MDGLRVTARTLRKQPVFTTVVILSLALAIALNTTMYGVLDALTHPRLDMRSPERLYWIRYFGDYKHTVDNAGRDSALATGMRTYESVTRTGLVIAARGTMIERGQNFHEGVVAGVGPNYFDVVGPRVLAGRTFIASDAESPSGPVVLSEATASHLFTNGESAIGARVDIDHKPHTVVGVVSEASNFPRQHVAAWMVTPMERVGAYIRLIRLRDGMSAKDAARDLEVVANRIALAAREDPRNVAFRFTAAADPEFQIKGLEVAMFYAVAAVLLVACANLANLQLARGISRRRDLALRSALGATRRRLIAHLLNESLMLAAGGLATGLLFTFLSGKLLGAVIPSSMGQWVVEPHLSWRVLVFALIATVLCLILIGLAPSIYVSRADPNNLLKSGSGTGATKRNRRHYGILVGVEIAIALALSSAAALTVRAAIRANDLWFGFDPRSLATGYLSPPATPGAVLRYADLLQSISARVRSVDGVIESAAFTDSPPFAGGAVTVEDPGGVREFAAPNHATTLVSPSYFRTMQLPIVKGRDFLDGERDVGAVIIDEQTAHVLWPNADPIGAQIKFGELKSTAPYVRVVGVVGEQKGFAGDRAMASLMRGVKVLGRIYYLPGRTDSLVASKFGYVQWVKFVARAASHGETLPVTLRRSLFAAGDMRTSRIVSMDEAMGLTSARQNSKFVSSLFALFAALGVGLAAFGVYGVVAHSVAERRRELGVRIALGATARDILHAVLRESTVVALGGVALGLLATKFELESLRAAAFEDDLYNAPMFALVALVLAATTTVAALVPALRATRVDPTESLRND